MSDETDNEEDGEERKKKGKGEQEGAGAAGLSKTILSPAIAECMARFGVPMEKITEILRTWTHLKGAELARHLADFARGTARASAQLLVQFDAKGGFALVTDFLSKLTGRNPAAPKAAPDQTPHPR
ncbi:MAG: hypothetical protein PHY92_03775 [Alphaproteobacteria bacterium]|nr:hypothetical protein [Alphaproteobacteria bacterium]